MSVNAAAPPTGIRFGGGFSDIAWTPNPIHGPNPLAHGEISAGRGAYRVSATATRLLGGSVDPLLLTAFESTGPSGATALSGRFFLVSGVRSAVDRFSLSFDAAAANRALLTAGFFVATWTAGSGWQARNDLGVAESFTPLATDVVIAVGYRAATSVGIDSLKSLVPDSPLPAGIRYGEGVADIAFQANGIGYEEHAAGEMRLGDGIYRLPEGEQRRVPGGVGTTLLTPFDPPFRGNNNVGRFFVVSGKQSTLDRFALTFLQVEEQLAVLRAGFFLAVRTQAGDWQAVNNAGYTETFVPRDSDVVIAIGHRASTASPGMDGLKPLVPWAALSPRREALAFDIWLDHVYRVEFGRNLVTDVVDLGSFAPATRPSGIAHVSPGVALLMDWENDHLYRLEYTDQAVTAAAVSRLELPRWPWGMAHVGPRTLLVADGYWDGLYRIAYGGDPPTSTWVDYFTGMRNPNGLAHVAPGVALVSEHANPDLLFRVEYSDSDVTKTTNLGVVAGLHGLNGLTILPAETTNRAPSARDAAATTTEAVAVAIDVLANDSDADGDALTVASVATAANGTTAIQSDGSVAYTPNAGFTGRDSFGYAVSDGVAKSTATVTVTVDATPFAVYNPDTHTITVSLSGLVGDRFEVEETIYGGTPRVHSLTELTFTSMNPASGAYVYRIRACHRQQGCGTWSRSQALTVSIPPMYTDPPSIETDTVPGSLVYDVGVTKGGQAYVNIPVQALPGVNGLEPRLSIDYSGGRERQRLSDRLPGDVLGYGWRVSGLSTIRRCTKNLSGSPPIAFGNSDGLCLDGEPLVRLDDEDDANDDADDDTEVDPFAAGTEYRTYRESYARVVVRRDAATSEPWFEVYRPDGGIAEYGNTQDSRLRLASAGVIRTAPFLWSVNRERDAYGNEMTYHYHEDEGSGVRHALRIEYGSQGDAQIRFRYAARSDGGSTTIGTHTLTEKLLLHTIEVRRGGSLVREYRLVSETASQGWRRLDRVQLCGYDERGSTADCLRPMDFDWMAPTAPVTGFKTCVERFSDPLGRVTVFEQKTITDAGVQFTERPFGNPTTPVDTTEDTLAKPVVTAVKRDDGIGGTRRTEYAYHGKGYVSSLGWGFLGYPATRVKDTSSGVVTYYQYRLDRPHYARVSAVQQYDGTYDPDATELQTLSKRFTLHSTRQVGSDGSARYLTYAERQTELLYEGGAELGARQTLNTLTLDDAGLPTRTVQTTRYGPGSLGSTPAGVWGLVPTYGFVPSATPVTTSTIDLRNRTGTVGGAAQWLLGFTCRAVLEENRPGTPLRRQWTSFTPQGGSLDIATAVRFGATSDAACPMDPVYSADANLHLTQSYAYDAVGNLISAGVESTTGHVPRRTATASSFAANRYPQRIANAAGHAETHTYDLRFGLPKSSTDANGQTVSREYDPFGREVRYTTRDGVAVRTRHRWCGDGVTVCGRVGGVAPVMAVETDSTVGPRTVVYLDRLGRPLRTERESFDGQQFDREDTVYDARRRVSRASVPYRSSGSARPAGTGETAYRYDLHDRVIRVDRADGGRVEIVRRACGAETQETAKETVYNEAGVLAATRTRVDRYNLAGELAKTTEGGGTAADSCDTPALTDGTSTVYAYDSSGGLLTVRVGGASGTPAAREVASFAYDAAGHLTRSTNADAGRVDFSRTALGELRTRNPAGETGRSVSYEYDVLGRLTKATDDDGSSHWVYDGATNGKGLPSRRCRMTLATATGCGTSAAFDETYAYDTDARLASTTTAVRHGAATRTYDHRHGYDSSGRPLTTRYPSGLTVRYEYNAQGRLSRMLNDADSKALVSWLDRDARGNPMRERLGNGVLVTRTFDPASGRPTRQDVRLGGGARHDARYGWRTDGLLRKRSVRGALGGGASGLREETFVHDGLGRLTGSAARHGTAARTLSASYDALGNVLSKTSSVAGDAAAAGYDYAGALNAVRHATAGGTRRQYAYDGTGRLASARACERTTGTCTFATPGDATVDRFVGWDARGRPARVVVGSGLADTTPAVRETFRHGPGGARYERFAEWREGDAAKSARTVRVGTYEETLPGDAAAASVERTRLPGGAVHVRTTTVAADDTETVAETFEYRHLDHLGSAAAVSGGTGAALAVLAHDPFGGRRRADWTRSLTAAESAALPRRAARGFTGHEHLDRTGLVHTGGRLYDPVLGRFLSADPHVAEPDTG